jgi:hypothetical protein
MRGTRNGMLGRFAPKRLSSRWPSWLSSNIVRRQLSLIGTQAYYWQQHGRVIFLISIEKSSSGALCMGHMQSPDARNFTQDKQIVVVVEVNS